MPLILWANKFPLHALSDDDQVVHQNNLGKKKDIILALPQKTFKTALRLGTKVRIEKLIKRQKQIRLAKAMKKFSSSTEDTVIAIHLRN